VRVAAHFLIHHPFEGFFIKSLGVPFERVTHQVQYDCIYIRQFILEINIEGKLEKSN